MSLSTRIDLETLQAGQLRHDEIAHLDILKLPLQRQLTHFTLHFAKYEGRLIRAIQVEDAREIHRNIVDSMIILLAMANALGIRLADRSSGSTSAPQMSREEDANLYAVLSYVEVVGRMAKACESLDHMEDFPSREVMECSATELMDLVLSMSKSVRLDLVAQVARRWAEVEKKVASRQSIKTKSTSLTVAA